MELTFVTDLGQPFVVEIDPNMELENVMALLEVESGIPTQEQSISYQNRELGDVKRTMRELGVTEDKATLLLRKKVTVAGRSAEFDPEMMRLQLLGTPELMRELQATQPELASAAQNNPTRFAELLRQTTNNMQSAGSELEHIYGSGDMDSYDIETQRKIEENIRRQAVAENLQHALEYSPESFGRVVMLYIQIEVNGTPVKALVDSGAQQTIISPDCAEQCGIMRLLDSRFSGIAQGVGTAKILGRVHSTQVKIADLHLPCSFTVMEGREVDILFGLDMLKAYQACIDLNKNVLRIQEREVPFLPEHELPDKARGERRPDDLATPSDSSSTPSGPSSSGGQPSFPGGGHTLGSRPSGGILAGAQAQASSRHSEANIKTLMDLGVTREVAIQTLDAAGGNVDVAASLLF